MPQFGQAQGAGFLVVNDFVASPYHQGIGTVSGSTGKTKSAPHRVQIQFFDGFGFHSLRSAPAKAVSYVFL